jgi:hypothetical protein
LKSSVEAEVKDTKAELDHFQSGEIVYIIESHGLSTLHAGISMLIMEAWDRAVLKVFMLHLNLINVNIVKDLWLSSN